MSNRISRFFREPLVQFLLIGVCIYGAYGLFGVPDEEERDLSIYVGGDRIDAFISEWQSRWNRPPTRKELDGVIQQYVREEVLYRQALAMGLNENDPITRRRMAQKLEFLTRDLAQMTQPEEGELERYFQGNLESYREPDQITFTQVFFDPDKRGETTLDDAKEALARLRDAGVPDPDTVQAGDQFMLQNYFKSADENIVRRQLGSGFTESVMKLEAGEWHGPVLSGYGVHLVYVYDFQEGPAPNLTDVKTRVLDDWNEERGDTFTAEFIQNLTSRFDIVVDEIPTDRLVGGRTNTLAKDDPGAGEASSL